MREKELFFNSTGISLMRNNLCKSYSDCYSALQAWRATVANLKKKYGDAEAVGLHFGRE